MKLLSIFALTFGLTFAFSVNARNLESEYQARGKRMQADQNKKTWESYNWLVANWAAQYGGDIVYPENFRVTRYGTFFVKLSNGYVCKLSIDPRDNQSLLLGFMRSTLACR